MSGLDKTTRILVVIGAINWGLTAFDWNVVNAILGSLPTVEMIVYILVGLAGLWELKQLFD